MELNTDTLFMIIGAKEAELTLLRQEINRLRQEVVNLQPKDAE